MVTSATLLAKGFVILTLAFLFFNVLVVNFSLVDNLGAVISLPLSSMHLLVSISRKQAMTDWDEEYRNSN